MNRATTTIEPHRQRSSTTDAGAEGGCVVCGARGGRPVFEENGYVALACACGGLHLSPPATDVDPTIDRHPRSFYALPARMKLAWLAQSHPGGRMLEVGCGEGDFLEVATAMGYRASAIEAEPGRAARTRARLGIDVEVGLVEDTSLEPGTYDVVVHCDLLSHFPDPRRALERMTALLAPGGALFFEVGVVGGLHPAWYRMTPTLSLPDHRWFYTEPALERLLASVGLVIERRRRFSVVPTMLVGRVEGALGRTARRVGLRRRSPRFEPTLASDGCPELVVDRHARFKSWLRYRAGAAFAGLGEQTLLVVAVPA